MNDVFDLPPYSLNKEEKQHVLIKYLKELTNYHMQHSREYSNILCGFGYKNKKYGSIEDFFPLPVRIFKELELKSSDSIVKILTSSGTSEKVSRIFLDKETAMLQTKALIRIMQDFIGKKRLPMLIIDAKETVKDRYRFSARAAGIMGLSNFGRKHTFVLNKNMELNVGLLEEFLEKYQNEPFLMFGFTFMVWEYFLKQLEELKIDINLSNGILFHSGGWKKLEHLKVSDDVFKKRFRELTGLKRIHNFYGMAEQVGSVFVACEEGHLHTPNFADIIIRDPFTFESLGKQKEGIIELVSLIPKSYPGHVLLTEDVGTILGEDDCKCGRKGKYFKVIGRMKSAEARGCSDTFSK